MKHQFSPFHVRTVQLSTGPLLDLSLLLLLILSGSTIVCESASRTHGIRPASLALTSATSDAQQGAILSGLKNWWNKFRNRRSPPLPSSPSPPPPIPSPPPPAAASCSASTMAGYSAMTQLGFAGHNLHWRVSGTSLSVAVELLPSSGASKGWAGVAWSPDGGMANSDAVIANSDAGGPIATYFLIREGQVQPTGSFSIGSGAMTSTAKGGLVFSFTRQAGTGNTAKVQLLGPVHIIHSFASDGTTKLQYHGPNHHVGILVDFSCVP